MTKHVYILNLPGMKGIKKACSDTRLLLPNRFSGAFIALYLDRRKNELFTRMHTSGSPPPTALSGLPEERSIHYARN